MSSDGSITLAWGDGEHKFRLAIGQLRELQDKCKAGPAEILDRLIPDIREQALGRTGLRLQVDDVRETIRLGLIGGGMKPTDALIAVKRYVEDRPLLESAPIARGVLLAALVGVPEDPVGKGDPEETAKADGSTSPSSTVSEPSSDGQPDRSMN